MKANANNFIRIKSQRANIEIFLVSFGADQLDQPLQQVVARRLKFHAQEFSRLQEPAKVIMGSENEKLLLVLIPISAKAAKYRCAVIQSVRQDAEFHLGIGNDSAVVEDKIGQ